MAQLVVAQETEGEEEQTLPAWFLVEIVRDLPRIMNRKERDVVAKK